jgi:hypothetical protein
VLIQQYGTWYLIYNKVVRGGSAVAHIPEI